ncbi:alpha/beta fold hydrolase [Marinomonas mediterranea]|jgi:Predicted hydrolases or acyltransferases (alpha/beta hydrolase superfamily)|uniref:Alpha/beta hydrolase fold protein n=1 Tax=Marinomonas mediterranea (strain ATCC 700492 / JCM 21426 / NBRC 103028 / MMB-1) TaxID=717774 RepID=F2K2F3_MARM1|nr:alpha/beta fold hydrolase [Marinomonas mediterranea]ADZ92333.1 alpha/beta hydrolase fold protein [Marinomonas mediterranea MMB-1]WCN14331.1 alpha/beta fold hydrolase [Marinomonas mediterranea]WCN18383.1 alpha/beta fold hydrolase [Marinomonas mediterranea MMB-1]
MIHSKKYGENKPDLIVLHGLFGNADNWHSIAQSWSEFYTVHCLDLPNHGKSSPMEALSYPKMADSIVSWMTESDIDECYLLGHSMGGKVAMQLASNYPDKFKKLIVVDIAPVDYQPSHLEIFQGLAEIDSQRPASRKAADDILAKFESSVGVRQFLLKNLKKEESGFSIALARKNIEEGYSTILVKPRLSAPYNKPTLFIKGANSDYIQQKHTQETVAFFPEASVKVIPDTGHWLHAEKPVPFTNLVKRFLQH